MWPENMCQWNCTGLPVISYLSMNVNVSNISECVVALSDSERHCCFPHTHTIQTRRTHALLFSIIDRLVVPTKINSSSILCPKFCHNEIPQNSKALFFEVFNSGSHSFSNCLCFGNLMTDHHFLNIFTFFTQSKCGS